MKLDTYYGMPIEEMNERQLVKSLYEVSVTNTPQNHLEANALLEELKWHMTDIQFQEFKKELFKYFAEFYNQCTKSVMTSISNEIINHK